MCLRLNVWLNINFPQFLSSVFILEDDCSPSISISAFCEWMYLITTLRECLVMTGFRFLLPARLAFQAETWSFACVSKGRLNLVAKNGLAVFVMRS